MKLSLSRVGIEPPKKGIVYVLEIELEGKKLIKVGITSRRVEERVCEILTSIWKRYRVFPSCYVKRYKTFVSPADKEVRLHKQLQGYRYTTKFAFTGNTEIFDVSLDTVVEMYDAITD